MIAKTCLSLLLVGSTIVAAGAEAAAQGRRAARRPSAVAPAVSVVPAAPVRGVFLLREGTDIALTNRTELSSKTAHVGDRFDVEVAEAVKVGNATVIPAGTLGVAEVTVADKNGHIGKSGKLEVRMLYLKLGDTHVPLYGQFNQEGAGGTAGTIGATVVAGPFGLLVKGKSAIIKPGTQMHAFIKENTSLVGQ